MIYVALYAGTLSMWSSHNSLQIIFLPINFGQRSGFVYYAAAMAFAGHCWFTSIARQIFLIVKNISAFPRIIFVWVFSVYNISVYLIEKIARFFFWKIKARVNKKWIAFILWMFYKLCYIITSNFSHGF